MRPGAQSTLRSICGISNETGVTLMWRMRPGARPSGMADMHMQRDMRYRRVSARQNYPFEQKGSWQHERLAH